MNTTDHRSMHQRNAGLDVLRSTAILLVLISHSGLMLSPYFRVPAFTDMPDGVDLFFVLSGFLIGGIVIRKINTESQWTALSCADFLQRRWFRTLPNYFLFLLLNVVLIRCGLLDGVLNKNLFAYFIFLQNFFQPLNLLFVESWSLAVEEWFYLLFPLILMLLFRYASGKKRLLLITIGAFVLIPLFVRIEYSGRYDLWEQHFREPVVTRLDCIGMGLLAAFLNVYYNPVWKTMRVPAFIAGLALIAGLLFLPAAQHPFFYRTFYFSLNSFAVMLLLPWIVCYMEEGIPLKPFRFISNISYSLYLSNLPLLHLFKKYVPVHTATDAVISYTMYLLVLGIVSFLLFRFFEVPAKNLREKVSPWLLSTHNA